MNKTGDIDIYQGYTVAIANALHTVNELSELSEQDLLFLLGTPITFRNGCDLCINIGKLNKFKIKVDKQKFLESVDNALVDNELVSNLVLDGNYINIFFDQTEFIGNVLKDVIGGKLYGNTMIGESKTVYVEYSSPNIAKPFHVGHLRSTIIGSFITKIHKKMGYTVVSENYLGDWGKQYGLLALAFELYGDSENLKQEPIKHLFELYVRINKDAEEDPEIDERAKRYFKMMEDGDEEYLALWKTMRELSIEEYKKIYAQLNVEFDVYGGESEHSQGVVEQLNVFRDQHITSIVDGGAEIVDLEQFKLGKAVLMKSDGATLYIMRDIAAAVARWNKHQFEKMYYIVATPQTLHFKQLFKMLGIAGYDWSDRCHHIPFGLVKGMSTRKGEVVFLSDVFEEAKQTMLQQMKDSEKTKIDEIEDPEKTAEMIGLSSIVVADCSARRIKDYTFEWDRVTSFEGDTGPYLQYNHARMASIERKAKAKRGWDVEDRQFVDDVISAVKDSCVLSEPECRNIAMQIAMYPKATMTAYKTLEPSAIVQYCFGLCHTISSGNSALNVISASEDIGKARLVLFHAARLVLNDALRLLGLEPLIKM